MLTEGRCTMALRIDDGVSEGPDTEVKESIEGILRHVLVILPAS